MVHEAYPNFYPVETKTRTVKDLSGFWHIVFDYDDKGEAVYGTTKTIPQEARRIAIPSSYNDLFAEKRIRDFIGCVWYYKEVYVHGEKDKAYFIRVGSANYYSKIFINGICVGTHSGGHLPVTVRVPDEYIGTKILLTVMVDNNLSWQTIPPGERVDYTEETEGVNKKKLDYHFDFFHYSGIHRRVFLYGVPKTYLYDMTVVTKEIGDANKNATLSYELSYTDAPDRINIKIYDPKGNLVSENFGAKEKGEIRIEKPMLWDVGKGNLYTFTVELMKDEKLVDECFERIGIRTVAVKGKEFLLNGKPVYFTGFGRHEDFHITGRNIPDPVLIRDYELMDWIGANSFRTSHYPYSEEHMMLADEKGILVIDETPAVGLNLWGRQPTFCEERLNEESRKEHEAILRELVYRDKNRACVVMWSIANEAATGEENAVSYFTPIARLCKELDPTRPITNVLSTSAHAEKTIGECDVLCVNRYVAWYSNPGELGAVAKLFGDELDLFYEKFNLPIILTEFGTDTIAGFHTLPDVMFSEEYQRAFLKEYFETMDKRDFVIGEHIWNFADFMTKQGVTRIVGNRKGIFTRERQPKSAAFDVKERWDKITKG